MCLSETFADYESTGPRVRIWTNGKLAIDTNHCTAVNDRWLPVGSTINSPDGLVVRQTGLDFSGNDAGTALNDVINLADHYCAMSPKRVVVTDNAIYENSTVWAVQPILSWSDTRIRVAEPYRGRHSSLVGKYMHILLPPVPEPTTEILNDDLVGNFT